MNSWQSFINQIEKNINEDDINKFLNWKVIKQTMFHNAKFIEYKKVINSEILNKYPNLLKEDNFGRPQKYFWNRETSGNLIHHLFSLNMLLFFVGYDNFSSIRKCYEFGGGYGSFARIISRLLPEANYTIYDFEVFLKLQKIYLGETVNKNSNFFSKLEFIKEPSGTFYNDTDLYIALWSISESPLEVRYTQESKILRSKYVLIGYQDQFDGINNHEYFNNLKSKFKPSARCYDFPIKHLIGSNYLIVINE